MKDRIMIEGISDANTFIKFLLDAPHIYENSGIFIEFKDVNKWNLQYEIYNYLKNRLNALLYD